MQSHSTEGAKILGARNVSRRQSSWLIKPLSEVVAVRNRKEGSYMMLPEDIPYSAGLTPEINERWISVSSGSEGFSFKNMYEEILTKCEDERYRLDMSITLQSYGIEALEKAGQAIAAARERGQKVNIGELEHILYRKLKKMYTDDVDQVIEMVMKIPSRAIPVFQQHLKAKRDELLRVKEDRSKSWKDTCEKNYLKSLDYKTFCFKQDEKNNINTKGFLKEIKKRFEDREAQKINPLIRRGGTASSAYYQTHYMHDPNESPGLPLESDVLHTMGDSAAKKFPQYQILFRDSTAFGEAYQLILFHVLTSHSVIQEKEKMKYWLNKILGDFFKFDYLKASESVSEDSGIYEGFCEEEVKLLGNETLLEKRELFILKLQ